MNKTILFLSFAFIAFSSCQQTGPKDSFTINGDIKGLKDPFIYLTWRNGDSTHLDSSAITDGKFKFADTVTVPERATLYLKDYKGYLGFFLENADINITGVADSMDNATITGSQSQDQYAALKDSVKDLTDQEMALSKQYGEARKNKDTATMAALGDKMDTLDKQVNERRKTFVAGHPGSFVSLDQLQGMTYETSYDELNKLFTGLDTAVQHSPMGKKLAAHLAIMEKTSIGKPALGFTQDDVNGKPVSLADFKGKYVLVDFWASWCGPCRAENPNVVKAYDQYKDKGFTVLGISLDEDSAKWKEAIAKDKLTWTEVSDLKGWKNDVAQQYGINAIPSNYLIDPNGTIIGHNLRGKALEDKLAEVLK